MKAKKRIKVRIDTDEVVSAVEQDLIQTWRDGMLETPASPLEAVSVLSLRHVKGLPLASNPSEEEFSMMLVYIYIMDHYTFSSEFPYTNQELKDDIAIKITRGRP
jgi:hypothetical protein